MKHSAVIDHTLIPGIVLYSAEFCTTMQVSNLDLAVCRAQVIAQKLRLDGDFDFVSIAARTPGFVGADLQALTKEAAALAVSRIFKDMQQPSDVRSSASRFNPL